MKYLLLFGSLSIIIFYGLAEYFYYSNVSRYLAKRWKKYFRFLIFYLNIYPAVFLLYFVISRLFIESVSFDFPKNLLMDWLFVYPSWTFLIIVVQTDLALILLAFIKLCLKIANKFGNATSLLYNKIRLAVVFIFLIYVPLGIIRDANSIQTTKIKVVKKSLPSVLDGFKIVFISDIHAGYYTGRKKLKNLISRVNELKPDLILIGGDFITVGNKYIELAAEEISRLKSEYGVYSCIGDHENWAYGKNYSLSVREIRKAFAEKGIEILDNENILLPIDSAEIEITFATNNYVQRISKSTLASLVDSSLHDFKIFLTHQPREKLIEAAAENNYDIYLCGHTHGGQLVFLFPFKNLSLSMLEDRHVRGAFEEKGLLVYVNRGFGTSIVPLRYNSTPEITLFTLKKE
jgi:predicted MPP superfamily phosphohydrolase